MQQFPPLAESILNPLLQVSPRNCGCNAFSSPAATIPHTVRRWHVLVCQRLVIWPAHNACQVLTNFTPPGLVPPCPGWPSGCYESLHNIKKLQQISEESMAKSGPRCSARFSGLQYAGTRKNPGSTAVALVCSAQVPERASHLQYSKALRSADMNDWLPSRSINLKIVETLQ